MTNKRSPDASGSSIGSGAATSVSGTSPPSNPPADPRKVFTANDLPDDADLAEVLGRQGNHVAYVVVNDSGFLEDFDGRLVRRKKRRLRVPADWTTPGGDGGE